jgi:hypothetical protein
MNLLNSQVKLDKLDPNDKSSSKLKNYPNLHYMKANASHMLYAFEKWEKRAYIIEQLKKGIHIIVTNYAFWSIVSSVIDVI